MSDEDLNICIIAAESREEGMIHTYICHLDTDEVEEIYASPYGGYAAAHNDDFTRLVLVEGYMVGDSVAHLWEQGKGTNLLYGKPLADRQPGEEVPLTAFGGGFFTDGGKGLVFNNALFTDTYGLGYLDIDHPEKAVEVPFAGLMHSGAGEFDGLAPMKNGRFYYSSILMGLVGFMKRNIMPKPKSCRRCMCWWDGHLAMALWKP